MSCFIYFYAECCCAECHYAECCYAECRYAKCRGATKMALLSSGVMFTHDSRHSGLPTIITMSEAYTVKIYGRNLFQSQVI